MLIAEIWTMMKLDFEICCSCCALPSCAGYCVYLNALAVTVEADAHTDRKCLRLLQHLMMHVKFGLRAG